MKASQKFHSLGSEDLKQRREHAVRSSAVLEPEDNGQEPTVVEVSPPREDGRPPKPSEDAVECPNWEKGRKRSRPWLRCQGWAVNGYKVCKHCDLFQKTAPVFRCVDVDVMIRVLDGAREALKRTVDSFKETQPFHKAVEEFERIRTSVNEEHERRCKNFFSQMREVQGLIPDTFANEASFLLSRCQRRGGSLQKKALDAFHSWKDEVESIREHAETEGVFPKWLFAEELRRLFNENARKQALSQRFEWNGYRPRR